MNERTAVTAYPTPPAISPHSGSGPRPFWSVMIPNYNSTKYLEKTLQSVLSQDPGEAEMQIEVVDDASPTVDPEPVIRKVAGDRVSLFRQPKNVGVARNWNTCIERAQGQWVHLLHSDDYVFPGFYERLRALLENMNGPGAGFCRHTYIDEMDRTLGVSDPERRTPGALDGFIEQIATAQRIQCVSIVVARTVYESLGGFRTNLCYVTDWEMWIRIAAHYPFWYEPSTLAAYRIHAKSGTSKLIRTGETLRDERRCMELVRPLLPPDRAEDIGRKAKELAADRAFTVAGDQIRRRELGVAFRFFLEGLRYSPTRQVTAMLLWRLACWGTRQAYAAATRLFA